MAFKTTQSDEGWQESLTRNDELGEKDTIAVRGMINFDINDDVSLLLRVHNVQDNSDNKAQTAYNGLQSGQGSVSNAHLSLEDYTDERGSGVVNTLTSTPPWFSTGDNEAADWSNSYTCILERKL